MFYGVGVSYHILYSIVSYLFICIKAVADQLPRLEKRERANLSAIVYL